MNSKTTGAQAILADLMQNLSQPTKQETVIGGLVKQLDAPYGVTSFEEMDAATEARRQAQGMDVLTAQIKSIVDAILRSPDIADKPAAIEAAAREFGNRARNPGDALKSANSVAEIKSIVSAILPFPVEPKPGPTFVSYILEGFEQL